MAQYLSREFDVCWQAPPGKPVPQSATDLVVDPKFDAATTERLNDAINKTWDSKLSQNPGVCLFNALKFRLDGQTTEGSRVVLHIGTTDYKSFIGTHYSEAVLQEAGPGSEDDVRNRCDPFLSHALGVESLVLTSDDQLVLIKRSDKVAEYPNFYCGPGGHAEPGKVLGIPLSQQGDVAHAAITRALAEKKAETHNELFQSAVDEVVDELGVPADTLTLKGLIGVARNQRTRGKPDLLFLVRSSQTRDEVQAVYNKGEMNEQFESTRLLCVPAADKRTLTRLLDDNQITPPSAAAVQWLIDTPDVSALAEK
eukprot:Rhum_TRINITY_DN3893_c0_g1::Rhum_TRINITY_DN3893_c0_g1_i1::g.12309::m.12309